jgi:hypothetical protein
VHESLPCRGPPKLLSPTLAQCCLTSIDARRVDRGWGLGLNRCAGVRRGCCVGDRPPPASAPPPIGCPCKSPRLPRRPLDVAAPCPLARPSSPPTRRPSGREREPILQCLCVFCGGTPAAHKTKKETGRLDCNTATATPRLCTLSLSPAPREVGGPSQDDADDDAKQPQRTAEDLHDQDFDEQGRVGRVGQRGGRADDADAQAGVLFVRV